MQMLKKLLSDMINVTKNAFLSLSRAPANHSFTFNLRTILIRVEAPGVSL